jgi:hypothetical protein
LGRRETKKKVLIAFTFSSLLSILFDTIFVRLAMSSFSLREKVRMRGRNSAIPYQIPSP